MESTVDNLLYEVYLEITEKNLERALYENTLREYELNEDEFGQVNDPENQTTDYKASQSDRTPKARKTDRRRNPKVPPAPTPQGMQGPSFQPGTLYGIKRDGKIQSYFLVYSVDGDVMKHTAPANLKYFSNLNDSNLEDWVKNHSIVQSGSVSAFIKATKSSEGNNPIEFVPFQRPLKDINKVKQVLTSDQLKIQWQPDKSFFQNIFSVGSKIGGNLSSFANNIKSGIQDVKSDVNLQKSLSQIIFGNNPIGNIRGTANVKNLYNFMNYLKTNQGIQTQYQKANPKAYQEMVKRKENIDNSSLLNSMIQGSLDKTDNSSQARQIKQMNSDWIKTQWNDFAKQTNSQVTQNKQKTGNFQQNTNAPTINASFNYSGYGYILERILTK